MKIDTSSHACLQCTPASEHQEAVTKTFHSLYRTNLQNSVHKATESAVEYLDQDPYGLRLQNRNAGTNSISGYSEQGKCQPHGSERPSVTCIPKDPKVMKIILKVILMAMCLFVAAFCAFGFLATFEPLEPGKQSGVLFLRIFYGVMGLKCLGVTIGLAVSFFCRKSG